MIVSVPDHCLSFYFEDSEKSVFTTKVQETEDMPLPEHLQEMYNCSVEKLSCEEAKLVKGLLLRHANVFSKSKSDLGNCGTIPHLINTGLAPPIRLSPRRVPIAIKDALDAEVQRLIDTNLFLNLFGFLECLVMWLISIPVIKV